MTAWLRHHWISFSQTVARLAASPFASFLNIVVIGVALALPLGGYVLLVNFQNFARGLATEPQISVFLSPDASGSDVSEIERRLRASQGVRELQFVGRDRALAALKRTPGMSEVIDTLKDNPLPDAFVVTLAGNDGALVERLENEFKAYPKVAHVQADSAWVKRVDGLLGFGRTVITLLGALLAFALVAVTFNTIRLQILTQRDEIEVARLVGATNAYIRRPFYYLGAVQGALGGLAALALVAFATWLLNRNLGGLSSLYGSELRLRFLEAPDGLAVLAFAAALGWLGAYLSVSKHLRQIDAR